MGRGDLLQKRITDANRVRELWTQLRRDQPDLSIDKAIDALTDEVARLSPSGSFYYLSSFKTMPPSRKWVRSCLVGKVGREVSLGSPLIPVVIQPKRGSLGDRVVRLERWVTQLADGLGVTLEGDE